MNTLKMYQYKPKDLVRMTSGENLKWIRELRKLTIEGLSEQSGIPRASILAAEENSENLSIEQIERIALAADCHPSSIAFPKWSSLPYEPEAIEIEGKLSINGIYLTGNLNVLYSHGLGLYISCQRTLLKINAFTCAMATEPLEQKSSINYILSSESLGNISYNDDPREPRDVRRTIKNISIKITYYRTVVLYEISGHAIDDCNETSERPENLHREDWSFTISFLVPASDLRRFYGLYPSAEESILKRMSLLGERAEA